MPKCPGMDGVCTDSRRTQSKSTVGEKMAHYMASVLILVVLWEAHLGALQPAVQLILFIVTLLGVL